MIQKAELWLYYGQNVLSNSFSGLYYSTYTGKISLWFCDALWKSNPSGCQNGGLFLVIITGLPCCALNLYLSKLHLQSMAVYPYVLTDDLLLVNWSGEQLPGPNKHQAMWIYLRIIICAASVTFSNDLSNTDSNLKITVWTC